MKLSHHRLSWLLFWGLCGILMSPITTSAASNYSAGVSEIAAEGGANEDVASEEAADAAGVETSEANEAAEMAAAFEAQAAEAAKNLKYQEGTIVLPGDLATIQLPADLRFLDADQTRYVLESLWGNPDGSGNLAMIVPADTGPLGERGWGVIIRFDEAGHISDQDAESIDYNELLQTMQSAEQESNDARRAAGYEPVHLTGWAKPPHYDRETKKLHWAKDLQFGEGETATHVLNYAIRVLGRSGYLELNAVADIGQLEQIEAAIPGVLSSVEFNAGHRYADFDPSTDKIAEYGIAALVLGGVAAKIGLVKGFLAILLAAKKFILIGVLALGGFVSKLFKKA